MARLPVPGSDNGTWGSILNDFLGQSLNGDGTLKPTSVQSSGALMSGATAGGDLSGTYPNPSVASVNGVTISGTPTTGALLTATSASAAKWQSNAASNVSIFNVKDYGAVGDGTTDDTAAINTAINTAVSTAQSNGTFYAEVYFPPAVYLIGGALTKGGTTKGNAQIPLPIIPVTSGKVTLVLKGVGDASALPHWDQTTHQINGAVLKSTASEAMDNTNGEASVIGGPTPQQGYGTSAGGTLFNNMYIVIDGLEIMVPNDHTNGWICGFDFRGMAEARVKSASVYLDGYPNNYVIPNGSGYEFGLAMPFPANNDNSYIETFSVEGFTYGVWLGEHVQATNIRAVYCYAGFLNIGSYENSAGEQHNAHVSYASAEACTHAFQTVSAGKIVIDMLDVENCTEHVNDSSGTTPGYIGLTGIISSIVVSDPTKLRVVYLDQGPGATTAPTMPASGTALRNPFWRDAAVTITGGTVTAIAVDGVTLLTTTPGTVFVPTGKSITLTYSVAPSWNWTLL